MAGKKKSLAGYFKKRNEPSGVEKWVKGLFEDDEEDDEEKKKKKKVKALGSIGSHFAEQIAKRRKGGK